MWKLRIIVRWFVLSSAAKKRVICLWKQKKRKYLKQTSWKSNKHWLSARDSPTADLFQFRRTLSIFPGCERRILIIFISLLWHTAKLSIIDSRQCGRLYFDEGGFMKQNNWVIFILICFFSLRFAFIRSENHVVFDI